MHTTCVCFSSYASQLKSDVRLHWANLTTGYYMSVELHIFLNDSRVPSREAWQQTIEDMAFPTILDTTLDVRKHTGFLPTFFSGQSAGFEFYLEPAENVLSSYSHIAEGAGGREKCATFRWGGDRTEMAAALSAAAAVTKISNGVYYDPSDDILYGADEAVEANREELNSL